MSKGAECFLRASSLLTGIVLLWAVFYFGFYVGYGSWKNRHHQAFAKQSVALISPAAQLNGFYSDCRNFITYNEPGGGPTWNTIAFFEGRYQITLQIPVAIQSPEAGETIGPARFSLLEIEEIDISGDSAASASYSNDWDFGLYQWEKVFAAKGDFSVINIPIVKGQPHERFGTFTSRLRASE